MWYYLLKLALSAAIIVIVSEVSKRYSILGGLLASLPLTSYLAMIWLYIDTRSTEKVSALALSIFWLVLPSLALFAALPFLLRKLHFALALPIATVLMFAAYGLMILLLKKLGISV